LHDRHLRLIQLNISLSKSSWKIQVFKENWCEFDTKILTQYNIMKAIVVFIIFLVNMSKIENSDCRYFDSVELVRHDWINWDHVWCVEKTILKYLFIIILSLMFAKIKRWLQLNWASICLDERMMKSYAHIYHVEENKRFDKNDSSSLVIIDLHFKVILQVKLIVKAIEKMQQINILLVCFRECDECMQLAEQCLSLRNQCSLCLHQL